MKSSKVDNFFEIDPAMEKSKSLSPLTYYQPFKSSFDPGFGKPASPPSTMEPLTPGVQGKMRISQTTFQKLSGNMNLTKIAGNKNASVATVLSSRTQVQTPKILKNSCLGDALPKQCDNIFTQRFPSCSRQWNANSSWSDRKICIHEGQNLHYYSKVLSHVQSDTDLNKNFSIKTQGNSNFRNCNSSDLNLKSLLASSRRSNFDTSGTVKSSTCNAPVLMNSSRSVTHNSCESGVNRLTICNFCKNNKEVPDIYMNHNLYDPETKKLTCPVLRKHVCGICGETGDRAHTLQYCPVNKQRGLQAKVPVLLKTRTITNSTGKIRKN